MSEIPRWRRVVLTAGIAIALLNPAYFIVGINFASSLIRSDSAYGRFVATGILFGVIAFACGILGKGPHRWKVIVGACVETLVWWGMAVIG